MDSIEILRLFYDDIRCTADEFNIFVEQNNDVSQLSHVISQKLCEAGFWLAQLIACHEDIKAEIKPEKKDNVLSIVKKENHDS